MTDNIPVESLHGVLVNIHGHGVLITGKAGIGKSSLALELLHQGHSLIADDIVDFRLSGNTVTGYCPPLLSNLLHTRELGLFSVTEHFSDTAWQSSCELNYLIELHNDDKERPVSLSAQCHSKLICQQHFPILRLAIHNPASLSHRLLTWLSLRSNPDNAEHAFRQNQHNAMAAQSHLKSYPVNNK